MNLDENAKEAVRELGDAINSAIEKSPQVSNAMENLRDLGYEPNLTLRLEIGLLELVGSLDKRKQDIELELTEDDLKTLRKMKIKFNAE